MPTRKKMGEKSEAGWEAWCSLISSAGLARWINIHTTCEPWCAVLAKGTGSFRELESQQCTSRPVLEVGTTSASGSQTRARGGDATTTRSVK